jgi:hypothetical protein
MIGVDYFQVAPDSVRVLFFGYVADLSLLRWPRCALT